MVFEAPTRSFCNQFVTLLLNFRQLTERVVPTREKSATNFTFCGVTIG